MIVELTVQYNLKTETSGTCRSSIDLRADIVSLSCKSLLSKYQVYSNRMHSIQISSVLFK